MTTFPKTLRVGSGHPGMYSKVQTGMPRSLRLGRLRKRESPFFFCTVHWAIFYRRQRGVELLTEIESTNKKSLFFFLSKSTLNTKKKLSLSRQRKLQIFSRQDQGRYGAMRHQELDCVPWKPRKKVALCRKRRKITNFQKRAAIDRRRCSRRHMQCLQGYQPHTSMIIAVVCAALLFTVSSRRLHLNPPGRTGA